MFSIWLKLEKRLSDQQLKIQNRGFEYVYLVTVVLRGQSGSPVIVTQSLQKVREKLRLKIRSIPAELQGQFEQVSSFLKFWNYIPHKMAACDSFILASKSPIFKSFPYFIGCKSKDQLQASKWFLLVAFCGLQGQLMKLSLLIININTFICCTFFSQIHRYFRHASIHKINTYMSLKQTFWKR